MSSNQCRAGYSEASQAAGRAMFGGSGGGYGGGGGGECGDGYGLGYVAGGGRLQQYAAHFAPHQNVWHHHHAAHHDSYGKLISSFTKSVLVTFR